MISQDEKIRAQVQELVSRLDEPAISCRVEDGSIVLEGVVSTDERSSQVENAVRQVPGVRSVRNTLMVEGYEAAVENEVEGIDLTPDFTADVGTDDSLEAASEAEPYTPPTDPVIGTSGNQADDVEILNGFAESADQSGMHDPRSIPRGDEELVDAVRGALRLDAATTDLDILVTANDGVVTLRGLVQSLDEADMAESVAASVTGVDEVVDELQVEGM